jgi:excinuclease ABC subunit B
MGRAARHVEGHVIMYADHITGSMKQSIDEVQRRRKIQEEYNKAHGITPTGIKKSIKESRLAGMKSAAEKAAEEGDLSRMSKQDIAYLVEELRDEMDLAAKNLDFEKAAELRDRISKIRQNKKRVRHKLETE